MCWGHFWLHAKKHAKFGMVSFVCKAYSECRMWVYWTALQFLCCSTNFCREMEFTIYWHGFCWARDVQHSYPASLPQILSKMAAAAAAMKKSGGDSSYISLFRTVMLRRISLCTGALWWGTSPHMDFLYFVGPWVCVSSVHPFLSPPFRFGVAFSYYGMSMNITGFGLGMYMTQFVFGVIEIPAKLIVLFAVNRVGRKQCQAWTLILAGLCIGANIVIPTCK